MAVRRSPRPPLTPAPVQARRCTGPAGPAPRSIIRARKPGGPSTSAWAPRASIRAWTSRGHSATSRRCVQPSGSGSSSGDGRPEGLLADGVGKPAQVARFDPDVDLETFGACLVGGRGLGPEGRQVEVLRALESRLLEPRHSTRDTRYVRGCPRPSATRYQTPPLITSPSGSSSRSTERSPRSYPMRIRRSSQTAVASAWRWGAASAVWNQPGASRWNR